MKSISVNFFDVFVIRIQDKIASRILLLENIGRRGSTRNRLLGLCRFEHQKCELCM